MRIRILPRLRLLTAIIISLPLVMLLLQIHYSVWSDFENLVLRLETPFSFLNTSDTIAHIYLRKFRELRQAMMPLEPPLQSGIPSVKILAKREDLNALDSDLPRSGKEYQKAWLQIDGVYQPAKIRYRGDFTYHWFYEKKSFRIKASKRSLVQRRRLLNLIVPKFNSMLHDELGYHLARDMGILSPDCVWADLYLNNEYRGVHLLVDQIDESWIRINEEMPGNLYSGDNVAGDRYIGVDSDLFTNPYLWERSASSSTVPDDQRGDLQRLIRILALPPTPDAVQELKRIVSIDEVLRWAAYASLVNSLHFDKAHNQKLYLDPSTGKFRPICWDPVAWNPFWIPLSEEIGIDIANNRLLRAVLRNPLWLEEKNRIVYDYISSGIERDLLDRADSTFSLMAPNLHSDAYKGFSLIGAPMTDKELTAEVDRFKRSITDRCRHLSRMLDHSRLVVSLTSKVSGIGRLRIASRGVVSAIVDSIEFDFPAGAGRLELYKDLDADGIIDVNEPLLSRGSDVLHVGEILYPGRRVQYRISPSLRQGVLKPASLEYCFLLKEFSPGISIKEIHARNSLTGKPIIAEFTKDESLFEDQFSIHPWQLIETQDSHSILWSGTVYLGEDTIIGEGDTLCVSPGTVVLLDPDVSILCEGVMIAEGRKGEEISFLRADPSRPWGVLALQGGGSEGSRFRRCRFDGGSWARSRLIEYTGMISAYRCPGVIFEDCIFRANSLGDDALRALQSRVDILTCLFEDTFSDAVDFDYSDGLITHNLFDRIGNDAVDLMTSSPRIENNLFRTAGDKGLSIGEASRPVVFNNLFANNHIGIEIKDGSDPLIVNCAIVFNNDCGIHSYQKNWRYGEGGKGKGWNLLIGHNRVDLNIEARSDFALEYCVVGSAASVIPTNRLHTSNTLFEIPSEKRTRDERFSFPWPAGDATIVQEIGAKATVDAVPVGLYDPNAVRGVPRK